MRYVLIVVALVLGHGIALWYGIKYAAARDCASITQVLREDTNEIVTVCVDVDGRINRERINRSQGGSE